MLSYVDSLEVELPEEFLLVGLIQYFEAEVGEGRIDDVAPETSDHNAVPALLLLARDK
jgi:hypothetical protein